MEEVAACPTLELDVYSSYLRTLQDNEQTSSDDDVWKTSSDEKRARKTMEASLVARQTSWSAPLGLEARRSKEDADTLAGTKSKMMVTEGNVI